MNTLLNEFRAIVAQAKRKQIKGPEEEALIAAGNAVEYLLQHYAPDERAEIFEGITAPSTSDHYLSR
jgi:hypothetical protein